MKNNFKANLQNRAKVFKLFLYTRSVIIFIAISLSTIWCSNLSAQVDSLEQTYTIALIQTNLGSYDPSCSGPAILSFNLPEGEYVKVTGLVVEYSFISTAPYSPLEQRSKLNFLNNESGSNIYSGSINIVGDSEYYLHNLSIANGDYAGGSSLNFELEVWKMNGSGAVCNSQQYIANGTWKIKLYFEGPITTPKIGVNTQKPATTFDVNGKIRIGGDFTPDISGSIKYDTTTQEFYGYNGLQWRSFSGTMLTDSDEDTKIETELQNDEDVLRFITHGTERWTIDSTSLAPSNGTGSIFVGKNAGANITSGVANIAYGRAALYHNSNQSELVAIGDSALYNNGLLATEYYHGIKNLGIGNKALYSNNLGYWNTAIGNQSLYSNTSGFENMAIGDESLYHNTLGVRNMAMGTYAMRSNVDGEDNTSIGNHSLQFNESGDFNLAIGNSTMYHNLSGSNNAAIGSHSLVENTTGNSNLAIGNYALSNNVIGNFNIAIGNSALYHNVGLSGLVAIGDSALYNNGLNSFIYYHSTYNTAIGAKSLLSNTTGYWNTALGYQSLYSNTIGNSNTAIGNQSLFNNTEGWSNTAIGNQSLLSNTEGEKNTAIGNNTLLSNTEGDENTAIGNNTLLSNTEGDENTAIGNSALRYNIDGERNVAIGSISLHYNQNGSYNTAVGYGSLVDNISGSDNVGIGMQALRYNQTGYENTAVGKSALSSNITGHNNTSMGFESMNGNFEGWGNSAFGKKSLHENIGGNSNTAVGRESLYDNTEGSDNTAVGARSLDNNTTGNSNTAIGFYAFSTGTNYSNSTALGNDTEPGASNTVRLGNASVSTIGGYANWSNVSDARFKKNVNTNVPGLVFINALRPVTYTLDMESIAAFLDTEESTRLYDAERLKEDELQSGFIAQEVEVAAQNIGYDFHGVDKPKTQHQHYGLRYAEFTVPLVKAVQELSEENAALRNIIDSYEVRLSKLEATLIARGKEN